MADPLFKPFSGLPAAGPITGDEVVAALQDGDTVQVPLSVMVGPKGDTGNSIARPIGTLASAAGVVNIDLAAGEVFDLTPTEAITSWTVSHPPAAGKVAEVRIRLLMGATAYAVASPAAGKTAGGTWVASTAASAMEWLGLEIDHSGAISGMVASGVLA
jgi:hypothetical protein